MNSEDVGPGVKVLLVGYDAWTDAVLESLDDHYCTVRCLLTTDLEIGTLDRRDVPYSVADRIDESTLEEAGAGDVDVVLAATLDEQQNVLAVLTADGVTDATIGTFVPNEREAPKFYNAGADVVVPLGDMIGRLLVETALADSQPEAAMEALLEDETIEEATVGKRGSTERDEEGEQA